MDARFQRLADRLYELNDHLSIDEARMWVEFLWEDSEATRAKSGREYVEQHITEQMVLRWIEQYGPMLHELKENHPKYRKMFEENNPYH